MANQVASKTPIYDELMDEWVERWHTNSEDIPLHLFLGMSEDTYGEWVRNPDAPRAPIKTETKEQVETEDG